VLPRQSLPRDCALACRAVPASAEGATLDDPRLVGGPRPSLIVQETLIPQPLQQNRRSYSYPTNYCRFRGCALPHEEGTF